MPVFHSFFNIFSQLLEITQRGRKERHNIATVPATRLSARYSPALGGKTSRATRRIRSSNPNYLYHVVPLFDSVYKYIVMLLWHIYSWCLEPADSRWKDCSQKLARFGALGKNIRDVHILQLVLQWINWQILTILPDWVHAISRYFRYVESSLPGLMEERILAMFYQARRSWSRFWQVLQSWSSWLSSPSRFWRLLWWSLMQSQIWQTRHKLKARGCSRFQCKGP